MNDITWKLSKWPSKTAEGQIAWYKHKHKNEDNYLVQSMRFHVLGCCHFTYIIMTVNWISQRNGPALFYFHCWQSFSFNQSLAKVFIWMSHEYRFSEVESLTSE